VFHEKVIVTEGDGDARFYSAVADSLFDDPNQRKPDVMFTHTGGGKGGLPLVAQSIRALNVPVAVVADFDLLNDHALTEVARVDSGRLRAGTAEYRVIIVPECKLMPPESLARLSGFARSGGTLIFIGKGPDFAPGLTDQELRTAHLQATLRDLASNGTAIFSQDTANAVEHLRASDETLARVIDSVGPFRLQLIGASSTFGALAQAIVYQQLNGKAAAAIFARFCALFPGTDPTAALVLGISEEELRGAGLSRSKLLSLRDLAGKTVSGEIPTLAEIRLMEDDAIIERLTSVRGIGRWTVEMLLIFRLGRPDVLPADDYGIRKGFARAYTQGELPARKDVEAYGARWKPYRTVASWYLWRLAEQAPLQKSQ